MIENGAPSGPVFFVLEKDALGEAIVILAACCMPA